MIRDAVRRMRFLREFLRFHRVHMGTRSAIEAHQEARLRELIPYLAYHIPLYQRLLKACDIDPYSIRSLTDLPRLPMTDKRTFIGTSSQEYTDSSRPILGTWVTTSGSTGEPFIALRRVEVNLPYYGDSLHYRTLLTDRPWDWTVNWARVAHIRVLDRDRENHFNVPQQLLLHEPKAALERLLAIAPDVIETHASLLPELARAVERFESTLRVRYIISGSESLAPQARAMAERALGAIVLDRYGLEETGTIAMSCRSGTMHVHSETFVIEIVDAAGTPLPEGASGHVLVTDLYNSQMPIVRYDTGDRGALSWEPCACGLSAPRLTIQGRYAATLAFGERRIHQFEFGVAMDEFMNALLNYQVAKRSETSLVVRIVPGPAYSEAVRDAVRKNIEGLVGAGIVVDVDVVDCVSRVPRGKSRTIVDESRG